MRLPEVIHHEFKISVSPITNCLWWPSCHAFLLLIYLSSLAKKATSFMLCELHNKENGFAGCSLQWNLTCNYWCIWFCSSNVVGVWVDSNLFVYHRFLKAICEGILTDPPGAVLCRCVSIYATHSHLVIIGKSYYGTTGVFLWLTAV